MLLLIGEEVRQDGERSGVGDAPAHASRQAARDDEVPDVLDGRAKDRREREDGEARDHDPLLVEAVAQPARQQAKWQSH